MSTAVSKMLRAISYFELAAWTVVCQFKSLILTRVTRTARANLAMRKAARIPMKAPGNKWQCCLSQVSILCISKLAELLR